MLIANYRDRTLKSSGEAYNANDFALCFLCHSAAPFAPSAGETRADTRFGLHSKHLTDIGGSGSSTDIDIPGAGPGEAICAECHYRVHSTSTAPWTANRTYGSGVNFAPNVQPVSGQTAPIWTRTANGGNCTLRCHGENHSPESYPWSATIAASDAYGTAGGQQNAPSKNAHTSCSEAACGLLVGSRFLCYGGPIVAAWSAQAPGGGAGCHAYSCPVASACIIASRST